ncbi:hypothetical protein [Candidatus Electronema sp. PJ]|uniref:hypothetical protein n=1 Tax=Candidatus Electronema sp. PJ TaxID=3401572 RepID=UPI003AA934E2
MDEVKIFVELPQEVEKWLIQNETSLARLLRQQGVEVRESHELNPFCGEDGNATARELSLSFAVNCMAAAAFVAAVGIVADNILATMNKKTEQAPIRSLTMVRDAKGNPVFGKDGKPLYELTETPVLQEPRAENRTAGVEFQVKLPKDGAVFLLRIGSSRQEIVQQ